MQYDIDQSKQRGSGLLALSIILAVYRQRSGIDVDLITELKG